MIIQAAGNAEVRKHRKESCCDVKVTDATEVFGTDVAAKRAAKREMGLISS